MGGTETSGHYKPIAVDVIISRIQTEHGGCLPFLEIAASMAISANTDVG